MAGVMHIGAGLVGLKSENVHGTRATSEFREPQNLNTMVFGGELTDRGPYCNQTRWANSRWKDGRKETSRRKEGMNE